jgi:hypothetical protein
MHLRNMSFLNLGLPTEPPSPVYGIQVMINTTVYSDKAIFIKIINWITDLVLCPVLKSLQ